MRLVLCESKGNPRASREIRAQAGRFALAHYINLLSRYKNVLSTFGSKITPYIRHPFIFRTQIKIFLMESESSQTLHRQQGSLQDHFGEYPLNANSVCSSVSAVPHGYVVFAQIKVYIQRRKRIRVAQLTQKSIRCLHSVDILQNGTIGRRRIWIKSFVFFAQNVFS